LTTRWTPRVTDPRFIHVSKAASPKGDHP